MCSGTKTKKQKPFQQGGQRFGFGLGLGERAQPADKLAGTVPPPAAQQEEEEVDWAARTEVEKSEVALGKRTPFELNI